MNRNIINRKIPEHLVVAARTGGVNRNGDAPADARVVAVAAHTGSVNRNVKKGILAGNSAVATHTGSVNRNYDNTDDALIEGVATRTGGVNRNRTNRILSKSAVRKDLPATDGWVFFCVAAVWNRGGSVAAGNRRQQFIKLFRVCERMAIIVVFSTTSWYNASKETRKIPHYRRKFRG